MKGERMSISVIETEKKEEVGIKYYNINTTLEEIERRPDVVRLYADKEHYLEFTPAVTPDVVSWEVIEDIKKEIQLCIGRDKFCYTDEYSGDGFYYDDDTLKECLRIIDKHIGKR